MRKLTFVKGCRVCGKEFYTRQCSEEQFGNLTGNEYVRFEHEDWESKAILTSICGECIPNMEVPLCDSTSLG